jgi:hypothetical protein
VEKKGQEFEFLYTDDSKENPRKIACTDPARCGNPDWDLVCDNDKLVDWCEKDRCCKKENPPCGRKVKCIKANGKHQNLDKYVTLNAVIQ